MNDLHSSNKSASSLIKLLFASFFFFEIFILSFSVYAKTILKSPPSKIDTSRKYLFYLHGRIVELKGIRPTSKRYGVYEYKKILETFADSGFTVISEPRSANTVPWRYADKIEKQIDSLLNAGVNPGNITVVGASKGAAIAVLISNFLKNKDVNFVVIAICNRRMADYWARNNVHLWGNVLYIYDSSDVIAESCKKFLDSLKSKGLKHFKEIELNLGLGHGILFRPIKEWVNPTVRWARGKFD